MPLGRAATPAATEPGALAGEEDLAGGGEPASLSLASAVMFVSDLDRAVAFYAELLAWTIAVHDVDAALLLPALTASSCICADAALEPHTSSATSACSTSSGPRPARTTWVGANGY